MEDLNRFQFFVGWRGGGAVMRPNWWAENIQDPGAPELPYAGVGGKIKKSRVPLGGGGTASHKDRPKFDLTSAH